MENDTQNTIFSSSKVKKGKDKILKNRLQAIIASRNLKEYEFYNSLGYSKQVWYAISWGIWDATIPTKIKIAQALGTDSRAIWTEEGST